MLFLHWVGNDIFCSCVVKLFCIYCHIVSWEVLEPFCMVIGVSHCSVSVLVKSQYWVHLKPQILKRKASWSRFKLRSVCLRLSSILPLGKTGAWTLILSACSVYDSYETEAAACHIENTFTSGLYLGGFFSLISSTIPRGFFFFFAFFFFFQIQWWWVIYDCVVMCCTQSKILSPLIKHLVKM